MKILIIGNGYLGKRCHESWKDSVLSDKKVHTVGDIEKLIDEHTPDAVLNAAGVVGKPNVDWCETHQLETIKGNTVLPITIAEACRNKGVYLLHMGTGCIFYGVRFCESCSSVYKKQICSRFSSNDFRQRRNCKNKNASR